MIYDVVYCVLYYALFGHYADMAVHQIPTPSKEVAPSVDTLCLILDQISVAEAGHYLHSSPSASLGAKLRIPILQASVFQFLPSLHRGGDVSDVGRCPGVMTTFMVRHADCLGHGSTAIGWRLVGS